MNIRRDLLGHFATTGQLTAALLCLAVGLMSLMYGLEFPPYKYTAAASTAWLVVLRVISLLIGAIGIVAAVAMTIVMCFQQIATPSDPR